MSNLIHLLDRPIAYNPALAKLKAGRVRSGPVAAVFLSQMLYWHNRMDGSWMYKTQADIASETALTRDEQETARKRLVELGVLEEKLRGVPATMHYRINVDRLEALLTEVAAGAEKPGNKGKSRLRHSQNVETPQTGLVQHNNLDCGNTANKNAETPQTSSVEPNKQACGDPANLLTGDYTENTQKITQDKNTSGQPPSADDRGGDFSEEIHITDQAILVLKHLNLMTGARYTTAKTTLENIRARIVDGNTADELKLVVEYLTDRWLGTEWAKHLNPVAMFKPEKFSGNLLAAQAWDTAGRKSSRNNDPDDSAERDAAYLRFIGSGNPVRNPSKLEQVVKTEASKARVGGMRPEFAVSRWNSIWKDCAQRMAGGNAA